MGRASLTVRLRPPMSAPLRAVIAARPSSSELMVTNPNPRERPVVRSIMTIASVTVPCAPKTSRRSASLAEKGRFPIYNFILLVVCWFLLR